MLEAVATEAAWLTRPSSKLRRRVRRAWEAERARLCRGEGHRDTASG